MSEITIRNYEPQDEASTAYMMAEAFHAKLTKLSKFSLDESSEFIEDMKFLPDKTSPNIYIAEIDGLPAGVLSIKTYEEEIDRKKEIKKAFKKYGIIKCLKSMIAFSMFDTTGSDDGSCYIDFIAVNSRFRGKGVGTALLNKAKTHACENGFKILSLDVVESNPKAEKLYKREGFKFIKKKRSLMTKLVFGESGWIRMEYIGKAIPVLNKTK